MSARLLVCVMLKWVLLGALMLLMSACQMSDSITTPAPNTALAHTDAPAAETLDPAASTEQANSMAASTASSDAEAVSGLQTGPQWLEFESSGVNVGLWLPVGWIADTSDGLIMAEHGARFDGSPSGEMPGVLVYIFVPPLEPFDLPEDESHNMALAVLSQVVHMPDMIGGAAVSEPSAFVWNQHASAYYLLTSPDGTRTMVMAIALPNKQLVVCNVSVPEAYVGDVRDTLPEILNGLTINGAALDAATLEALPDDVHFPPAPTVTPTPQVSPPNAKQSIR